MVYESVDRPGSEIISNQSFILIAAKVEHGERDTECHKTHSEKEYEGLNVIESCLEELDVESCAIKKPHPVDCFEQHGKA